MAAAAPLVVVMAVLVMEVPVVEEVAVVMEVVLVVEMEVAVVVQEHGVLQVNQLHRRLCRSLLIMLVDSVVQIVRKFNKEEVVTTQIHFGITHLLHLIATTRRILRQLAAVLEGLP